MDTQDDFLESSRYYPKAGGDEAKKRPGPAVLPGGKAGETGGVASGEPGGVGGTPVDLPEPQRRAGPSLWEALERRASVRDYTRGELSLEELGQVVWAASGCQASRGGERRTAPSAGGRYPVETYLVANRVKGLAPGLYHYDPSRHRLEPRAPGDMAAAAKEAALGEEMVQEAAAVLVWTAVVERSRSKYQERASRYIFLDVGHVGQNLHLAAAALGLGCCMVGAFFDREVEALVGADGTREVAVYMATVGRPG